MKKTPIKNIILITFNSVVLIYREPLKTSVFRGFP